MKIIFTIVSIDCFIIKIVTIYGSNCLNIMNIFAIRNSNCFIINIVII